MTQTKPGKSQKTAWPAVWISGIAIVSVFVGLELRKPSPQTQEPLTAAISREHAAPPPAKVHTAEPVVPSTMDAPEARPAPTAAFEPTPAPVPSPQEPESSEPDAAERLTAEPDLLLAGPDSLRDAATRRDKELLKLTIEGKAWDAYRELLGRSVKTVLADLPDGRNVNRFDPVWKEPALYQALLRWKTLACFSEPEISQLVGDPYTGQLISWLLNNNQAMEELLLTFRPEDDGYKVLKFLMDTWSENQETQRKYFPLALACAVVFDNPVVIPHPIGSVEYGAKAVVDPLERFYWFVEKNEHGKLAAPVDRSSARDLVWVVCAPVTTSELEWSIDKMHLSRKHWGNAYSDVEYLMERAVNGLNPYKEYSFAEILKEGGICGDQSYFCVNTARAHGIPAMTIAGETDLGGHAWAGMKIASDEWTTGVGRIGGASKGQAENPQTGGHISEQEIQLWNDRYHQSPVVTLSAWRHMWLADFFSAVEDADGNAAAVHLANQLGHSFPETWKALYTLLESQTRVTGDPGTPENLEDWKKFAKDMRQEFKDNPRMAELAANAEAEYIFPYGPDGDARRTLMRERRRVARNSGEQADLIAGSIKREAELISKRGGEDATRDISRLYDRALRDYGGSITGFKTMAEDYFSFCKEEPELARKAARDIELAFKRVVETGTKDWFRANTESSIYMMICSYYRQAGDPGRADMLEKRYEVLLRRAKRSAL